MTELTQRMKKYEPSFQKISKNEFANLNNSITQLQDTDKRLHSSIMNLKEKIQNNRKNKTCKCCRLLEEEIQLIKNQEKQKIYYLEDYIRRLEGQMNSQRRVDKVWVVDHLEENREEKFTSSNRQNTKYNDTLERFNPIKQSFIGVNFRNTEENKVKLMQKQQANSKIKNISQIHKDDSMDELYQRMNQLGELTNKINHYQQQKNELHQKVTSSEQLISNLKQQIENLKNFNINQQLKKQSIINQLSIEILNRDNQINRLRKYLETVVFEKQSAQNQRGLIRQQISKLKRQFEEVRNENNRMKLDNHTHQNKIKNLIQSIACNVDQNNVLRAKILQQTQKGTSYMQKYSIELSLKHDLTQKIANLQEQLNSRNESTLITELAQLREIQQGKSIIRKQNDQKLKMEAYISDLQLDMRHLEEQMANLINVIHQKDRQVAERQTKIHAFYQQIQSMNLSIQQLHLEKEVYSQKCKQYEALMEQKNNQTEQLQILNQKIIKQNHQPLLIKQVQSQTLITTEIQPTKVKGTQQQLQRQRENVQRQRQVNRQIQMRLNDLQRALFSCQDEKNWLIGQLNGAEQYIHSEAEKIARVAFAFQQSKLQQQQLRKHVESLSKEKLNLEERISTFEKQKQKASKDYQSLNKERSEFQLKLNNLYIQKQTFQQEIKNLTQLNEDLNHKLSQRDDLARIIQQRQASILELSHFARLNQMNYNSLIMQKSILDEHLSLRQKQVSNLQHLLKQRTEHIRALESDHHTNINQKKSIEINLNTYARQNQILENSCKKLHQQKQRFHQQLNITLDQKQRLEQNLAKQQMSNRGVDLNVISSEKQALQIKLNRTIGQKSMLEDHIITLTNQLKMAQATNFTLKNDLADVLNKKQLIQISLSHQRDQNRKLQYLLRQKEMKLQQLSDLAAELQDKVNISSQKLVDQSYNHENIIKQLTQQYKAGAQIKQNKALAELYHLNNELTLKISNRQAEMIQKQRQLKAQISKLAYELERSQNDAKTNVSLQKNSQVTECLSHEQEKNSQLLNIVNNLEGVCHHLENQKNSLIAQLNGAQHYFQSETIKMLQTIRALQANCQTKQAQLISVVQQKQKLNVSHQNAQAEIQSLKLSLNRIIILNQNVEKQLAEANNQKLFFIEAIQQNQSSIGKLNNFVIQLNDEIQKMKDQQIQMKSLIGKANAQILSKQNKIQDLLCQIQQIPLRFEIAPKRQVKLHFSHSFQVQVLSAEIKGQNIKLSTKQFSFNSNNQYLPNDLQNENIALQLNKLRSQISSLQASLSNEKHENKEINQKLNDVLKQKNFLQQQLQKLLSHYEDSVRRLKQKSALDVNNLKESKLVSERQLTKLKQLQRSQEIEKIQDVKHIPYQFQGQILDLRLQVSRISKLNEDLKQNFAKNQQKILILESNLLNSALEKERHQKLLENALLQNKQIKIDMGNISKERQSINASFHHLLAQNEILLQQFNDLNKQKQHYLNQYNISLRQGQGLRVKFMNISRDNESQAEQINNLLNQKKGLLAKDMNQQYQLSRLIQEIQVVKNNFANVLRQKDDSIQELVKTIYSQKVYFQQTIHQNQQKIFQTQQSLTLQSEKLIDLGHTHENQMKIAMKESHRQIKIMKNYVTQLQNQITLLRQSNKQMALNQSNLKQKQANLYIPNMIETSTKDSNKIIHNNRQKETAQKNNQDDKKSKSNEEYQLLKHEYQILSAEIFKKQENIVYFKERVASLEKIINQSSNSKDNEELLQQINKKRQIISQLLANASFIKKSLERSESDFNELNTRHDNTLKKFEREKIQLSSKLKQKETEYLKLKNQKEDSLRKAQVKYKEYEKQLLALQEEIKIKQKHSSEEKKQLEKDLVLKAEEKRRLQQSRIKQVNQLKQDIENQKNKTRTQGPAPSQSPSKAEQAKKRQFEALKDDLRKKEIQIKQLKQTIEQMKFSTDQSFQVHVMNDLYKKEINQLQLKLDIANKSLTEKALEYDFLWMELQQLKNVNKRQLDDQRQVKNIKNNASPIRKLEYSSQEAILLEQNLPHNPICHSQTKINKNISHESIQQEQQYLQQAQDTNLQTQKKQKRHINQYYSMKQIPQKDGSFGQQLISPREFTPNEKKESQFDKIQKKLYQSDQKQVVQQHKLSKKNSVNIMLHQSLSDAISDSEKNDEIFDMISNKKSGSSNAQPSGISEYSISKSTKSEMTHNQIEDQYKNKMKNTKFLAKLKKKDSIVKKK